MVLLLLHFAVSIVLSRWLCKRMRVAYAFYFLLFCTLTVFLLLSINIEPLNQVMSIILGEEIKDNVVYALYSPYAVSTFGFNLFMIIEIIVVVSLIISLVISTKFIFKSVHKLLSLSIKVRNYFVKIINNLDITIYFSYSKNYLRFCRLRN